MSIIFLLAFIIHLIIFIIFTFKVKADNENTRRMLERIANEAEKGRIALEQAGYCKQAHENGPRNVPERVKQLGAGQGHTRSH